MLISLHVKNLALIDEAEVDFKEGLNILTGETGAGKSIIMGSVNLALGAKADKSLIRTGAEYAMVELVFQITSADQERALEEMDIPLEEDGIVIVLRKLHPERSLCKVNGITVSQKQLTKLASLFINIHGQHETQVLLNVKQYSHILDEYGGDEIDKIKEELKKSFSLYKKLEEEIQNAMMDEKEKNREISLAEFEIREISEAALRPGEDAELEEKYKKMSNSRHIIQHVGTVYEYTGYGSRSSAGDSIGRGVKELKQAIIYDKDLQELADQLMEIEDLLNDFNRNINDYQKELEFEPAVFDEVERRLNQYNHLKDKYGSTIDEILQYKEAKENTLARLSDYEEYMEKLTQKKEKAGFVLNDYCKKLSDLRIKYGKRLEKELTQALLELNFPAVHLAVTVTPKEDKITSEGYDDVDFLISLNKGEPEKSISKVASGGELSRIMLALKAIMAGRDKIDTLIFDEIDSGISGKTAWKVSEKMAVLGNCHQLLCITHLPQIAAMADSHFMIEKKDDKERSVTNIRPLSEVESLKEIARLLGGTTITDTVLSNAQELKEQALLYKNQL